MRVILHRLFHFADAEARVGHAVGHPVALFGDVLDAKVNGVHSQGLGQLVNDRLHGEGSLGLTGGAR